MAMIWSKDNQNPDKIMKVDSFGLQRRKQKRPITQTFLVTHKVNFFSTHLGLNLVLITTTITRNA